jgi:hypothetical protein
MNMPFLTDDTVLRALPPIYLPSAHDLDRDVRVGRFYTDHAVLTDEATAVL